MPNPILEQIPVRLQISAISNPPNAPIDLNTGLPPAFWRGSGLAVALGFFDPSNVGLDLSNLSYLQVLIQESADSLVPLAVVQIDGPIHSPITIGAWRAGTDQNATAVFAAADLDVGLDALGQKEFWVVVRGFTLSGAPIVYAAGAMTGYNPGVPPQIPKLVSRHAQTTTIGDVAVAPGAQIHTEILTVDGAARTFKVVLGLNGVLDGALLNLVVNLPATADIVGDVKSGIGTNATIAEFGTGDVLRMLLQFYYDANLASWQPLKFSSPSP